MMRMLLAVAVAMGWACSVAPAAEREVIALYEGVAPGSEDWACEEREHKGVFGMPDIVFNVRRPTLTVFRPEAEKANGTAAVICPGGAFCLLSIQNEGYEVAQHLADQGVTCFVLKYRLLQCKTGVPLVDGFVGGDFPKTIAPIAKLALDDGLAAMKYVKTHAAEYGVKPQRVGIVGFSAGGSLAASVAYNYTKETRPAFVAPIYLAHDLAIKADGVRGDAPPLFAAAASDDMLNLAPDSIEIYQAWLAAKRPAELHLYAKGGHGFGMRKQKLPSDAWADRFVEWLDAQGLMKKPAAAEERPAALSSK